MYGVHWEMPGVGSAEKRLAVPTEKPIDGVTLKICKDDSTTECRGTVSGGWAVRGRGIVSPQRLTRHMRESTFIWKGGGR